MYSENAKSKTAVCNQMIAQIIYINGPSSSGKTTLAKALQHEFDQPFLHIGIDRVIGMMPEKLNNWEGGPAPLGFSWKESVDETGDLSIQLSVLDQNSSNKKVAKKVNGIKIYATSVSITVISGYSFHVADYYGPYGNSRIVTCLDGDMRGQQGIADNGVLQIESTNVKWYNDYFIHYYPAGQVTSYPNKQTCEFN